MKLKPKTVETDYSITFEKPFLFSDANGITVMVNIKELVDDGEEENSLLVPWGEVIDDCVGSVLEHSDYDVIIEKFRAVADRLEEIKNREIVLYNKALASRSTT